MENNSPTISKELQEQIEGEAKSYAMRMNPGYGKKSIHFDKEFDAYTVGATAYAHYKERCEDLEHWKREADALLSPLLDYGQSKEANIPLGANITAVILERAKRFEQAQRALEEISYSDRPGTYEEMAITLDLIYSTISALLASWKEEGKEGEG